MNALRRWLFRCGCAGWIGTAAAGDPLSGDGSEWNGGFERAAQGRPVGWAPVWARESGTAVQSLDTRIVHGGLQSARIDHTGAQDWSFAPERDVPVRSGDVIELEAWIRAEGEGSAVLSAIAYGSDGGVIDWSVGEAEFSRTDDWQPVKSRFVVSPAVSRVRPRFLGAGPCRVWVDDFRIRRTGNVDQYRGADRSHDQALTNDFLIARFISSNSTLDVTDRRNGKTWRQREAQAVGVATNVAGGADIRVDWLCLSDGIVRTVRIALEKDRPEIVVTVDGDGAMPRSLPYPPPFVTGRDTRLIVPMNEGIAYDAGDDAIPAMRLIAYGGHGLCMPFWGVTDGGAGQMAIFETPDDAAIRTRRLDGCLVVAPEWDPQKGRLGYARRLRYVFFDRGGYVAMARRYRDHAKAGGLLKTLAQKRRENPEVDRLVGAANVWCWDRDPVEVVRELKSAGIERILWSRGGTPEQLRTLNGMEGVLTSRYDVYQDLMDPEVVRDKFGGRVHGDWTQGAWPADIMRRADGGWERGWGVDARDGKRYYCAVLCDSRAVDYARKRVTAELETHPYTCRFIDTTTATPWRECYDPAHPMTRTDSRRAKMDLLKFMSESCRLVTGSETGHDAAVPYVHYFEGMLSLGPYRVREAGRNMARILEEVPPQILEFQLNPARRLPLWELVYHDCVVAQWYWGDYNNKLPSVWTRRDRFNQLYGTPPMYMFERDYFGKNRDRFAQSYRDIAPVARGTGYAEMTDHRYLSADRMVQQTEFSNGMRVSVNFGNVPCAMPDGTPLDAGGCRVETVVSAGR